MTNKERKNTYLDKIKLAHPQLDYTKTEYINSRSKVTITCHKHGDFKVYPLLFLTYICGCPKCQYKRINPKVIETSILKAIKKHGDKYDYSLVDKTIKSLGKQKIICKIHGVFEVTLPNHYQGCGCPDCAYEEMLKLNREKTFGWDKETWKKKGEAAKKFDSFKAYVIKCWNDDEVFYKVGKTFNKLKKRFSCNEDMPYKFEVVHVFEYKDAFDAHNKEEYLKQINSENKYVPKIKFPGMYECFISVVVS